MRAAYYDQQGGSEVIRIGDVDEIFPGPGEVRVRVAVSGANPSDALRRSGRSGPMVFPRITPHSDGAGTIDMVHGDVNSDCVGRRVWLYNAQWLRPSGTAAEYVCVPVRQAVPLPDATDFLTGATLGIPACTAHRCVFSEGPVAGLNVLVVGGAGSVGRYAIQLARWGGATVFTTVGSEEQAALAREAGANYTINYRSEAVVPRIMELTGGRGLDRIAELDFSAHLNENVAMLATNGVIAAYFNRADPQPALPFLPMMLKSLSIRFVLVYLLPEDARRRALEDIDTALRANALRPHIGRVYSLEETARAHDDLDHLRLTGNALIQI
jgi:NADPH2:quinone reductase